MAKEFESGTNPGVTQQEMATESVDSHPVTARQCLNSIGRTGSGILWADMIVPSRTVHADELIKARELEQNKELKEQ